MITPEEIEAALKLCEAATPGPWYRTTFVYNDPHMDDHEEGKACWTVGPDAKDENWTTDASCDGYGMLKKDADLCVAARTLLPRALWEVRALQSKLRLYEACIADTADRNKELIAENAKLLRVKEAADQILKFDMTNDLKHPHYCDLHYPEGDYHESFCSCGLDDFRAALKALDEEGK